MTRLRLLALAATVPFVLVLAAGSFAQEAADEPEAATTPAGEAGASDAAAAGEDEHADDELPHYPLRTPDRQSWSFAGPFGSYDTAQLQRGFRVFLESCANCHSLSRVAFRNLSEEGGPQFSEGQVRTILQNYSVMEEDLDGEMVTRTAVPSDRFPEVIYSGQGNPPDLSLIAKARAAEAGFPMFIIDAFLQYQEAGPDYVYALLTGYEDPPEGTEIPSDLHYNPYFLAGEALAMPPPLSDGAITYDDDTPETLDQYARDVAAFLMWTAEPHLDERKQTGFRVMIFLAVFAVLLYLVKRRLWSRVH